MVRYITSPENIPDYKISLKGKGDFRKVDCEGDELILKTTGTSYGFREDKTQKGDTKYTLPLVVPEEFADTLYKVAEKLGDVGYSPVYETQDGGFLIYVKVPMNAGGLVFANIHGKDKKKVHPKDRTGAYMNIRAIVKVESLRVGGEKPKLQLSLLQAELEDTVMLFEDLLD